jgi:hypothetical protein
MRYFDLLLDVKGKVDLESFARSFFSAVHIDAYEERESIHYVEERYFKGEAGGVIFKVMLSDDEDHPDLPFWVNIENTHETDQPFDIDALVQNRLLTSGFRVAQLINFGRTDEVRRDF